MYNTVLFDLDGTLIDTNELIIRSFFHALKDVRNDLTREEIIPQMGKLLSEQLRILSGSDDVDELLLAYRDYNVAHHNELVRLFPNVRECLQLLRQRGFRIGVVTTKMRASTERSLGFFDLLDAVDCIVTVEDVTNPKPHAEPILTALSLLDANPTQTMMVGDSQFDLLAAHAAGVTAIGVSWSLKGADHLRQFPPVTIIDDMLDLLILLSTNDEHFTSK